MSNHINQVLDALLKLREDVAKINERKENKFWENISSPLTLKKALSCYTRDQLHEIRRELNIKNASSLKKAEISNLLEERLPDYLEKHCFLFGKKQYQILEKIYKQQGIAPAKQFALHEIEYFRKKGFLFTGKYQGENVVWMPEELQQRFGQLEKNFLLKAKLKKNSEWIKLTNGLLYYYGTLTFHEYHQLLEKYTEESVDLDHLLEVVEESFLFARENYFYSMGLVNQFVFNPEHVHHEQKMRVDIEFYPFTKKQLLEAGEADFFDRNGGYRRLFTFLTNNFDIPYEHADELIKECIIDLNNDADPSELFNHVQSLFEFEDKRTFEHFFGHFVYFANHTRRWILRGHMPAELEQEQEQETEQKTNVIDFTTSKKIGRNDLCPCGSGKKFKKCCGNKQMQKGEDEEQI